MLDTLMGSFGVRYIRGVVILENRVQSFERMETTPQDDGYKEENRHLELW
ncbi:MAG TPA: hypothetical protein VIU13_10075 [Chryseolinea sp.]